MIKFLVKHKCLVNQGAAAVNMLLIFFMGGVAVQTWCEKHLGWAPNIIIPVLGATWSAWFIGWLMMKTGMIQAEQTFYAERNDVFNEIRRGK